MLSNGLIYVSRDLPWNKDKFIVNDIVDNSCQRDPYECGEQVVYAVCNQKSEEQLVEQDRADLSRMESEPLREERPLAITPIKELVTGKVELDTDDRLNKIRAILIQIAIMDESVE